MSEKINKFPEDLILTIDDFKNSDLENILKDPNHKHFYFSMSRAFSEATKKAFESKNIEQAKIYWLFLDVCSLKFNTSNNYQEPFNMCDICATRRSATLYNFNSSDLDFFEQILTDVEEVLLKARLADLLWIHRRKVQFALIAIDSYSQIPLDENSWKFDGYKCWNRVLQLSKLVNGGSGEWLNELESRIINALKEKSQEHSRFVISLAKVLSNNKLGQSKKDEIIHSLQSSGDYFADINNWEVARECYMCILDFCNNQNDPTMINHLKILISNQWRLEAEKYANDGGQNILNSIPCYESSIKFIRSVPVAFRTKEIKQQLNELEKHKIEVAKNLDFSAICFKQELNIKIEEEKIKATHDVIKGKTKKDALFAFVNLAKYNSIKDSTKISKDLVIKHPFVACFDTRHLKNGMVRGKTPRIDFHNFENNNEAFHQVTVSYYMIRVCYVVFGCIIPGLEILRLEHHFDEDDFIAICQNSCIVPVGREKLFAKGLFSGYIGDLMTAMNILLPQIENMLREELKKIGAKTTIIDDKGIESEKSLNALLDLEQAGNLLGEDLKFEIQTLMCDNLGYNLRNNNAHGLLNDKAYNSTEVLYCWWFVLKIIFNNSWCCKKEDKS